MTNLLRICMNWKVALGLAVVGVGTWALAPNLILTALPLLLLAICPISMLFMHRAMKHGAQGEQRSCHSPQPSQSIRDKSTRDERLAELKSQQEAIAQEVASLEAQSPSGVREA